MSVCAGPFKFSRNGYQFTDPDKIASLVSFGLDVCCGWLNPTPTDCESAELTTTVSCPISSQTCHDAQNTHLGTCRRSKTFPVVFRTPVVLRQPVQHGMPHMVVRKLEEHIREPLGRGSNDRPPRWPSCRIPLRSIRIRSLRSIDAKDTYTFGRKVKCELNHWTTRIL